MPQKAALQPSKVALEDVSLHGCVALRPDIATVVVFPAKARRDDQLVHQKHTACDAMLNFAAILTVYTPERSSVERRRCGESEGAERRDADTLAARAASGKEAAEKARKASPVWEPCCIKNAMNLQVAPRGAWHQNQPIGEKRRIPRIPHQASPAACCGCSQQR